MRGGLLVCGTSSGAGKSTVVTGLCRALARRGVRVAPFKAQNMSNQAAVTADGAEIGRAQYAQAVAAGVEPEAAMNPVLLKPTGERTSQVVVLGRVAGTTDAVAWGDDATGAPSLLPVVLGALRSLLARHDVVIAEGAGSPAELNLLERDIVNLPLARAAGLPAILVADIDRGGVFAAAAGTLAVLPSDLRGVIAGVVVNKLRGDPAAFGPRGVAELERVCDVPVLGVLPWLDGPLPDQEDSLDLRFGGDPTAAIDVAVIAFPHASNLTDLDPLVVEPGVSVRLVGRAHDLGRPHLVLLPGTKATVGDLAWLRSSGLADALDVAVAGGRTTVLGICGGLQVLGEEVVDDGVESGGGAVAGLGRLPVVTTFAADKVVRRRSAVALGHPVGGYELHHGRVRPDEVLHRSDDGAWWGTTLHDVFTSDGFRDAFLAAVAARGGVEWSPSGRSHADAVRAHHDRLADWVEANVDVASLPGITS